MSRRARVIPSLLYNGSGLVKTKQFKPSVYVGDVINAVRIFNEKEADELILLDIAASRAGRGPNFDMVTDIASECFMPLAYGGGIRSVDDAIRLVQCGVEKVVLNRSFRQKPGLVADIAKALGASSTVVSIDVRKAMFGGWRVFQHESSKPSGSTLEQAIAQAQEQGAGEIMVTVINREGLRNGPELAIARAAVDAARVPVVYNGGVATLDDIQALLSLGVSAVSAGAMFVLHGKHDAVLISYPAAAQIDDLNYAQAEAAVA